MLLLDKRHYPMIPVEVSWQWINAVKPILVFMEEVQCIRCDWFMTLQNISRWATDASESCFRKALTNLMQDDSSRTVQTSCMYRTGLRGEHFSSDFRFQVLRALHVVPRRSGQANLSLPVMFTNSPAWGAVCHVPHLGVGEGHCGHSYVYDLNLHLRK